MVSALLLGATFGLLEWARASGAGLAEARTVAVNAFVAGGQVVYIHSGLIDAADTANEVQGVIAHELGHITGGHIIRIREGYGAATQITLLSMLAGIGAALAGAGG